MEPELIADYRCHVGEGPIWNPMDNRLYWVDILRGRIFWYDPETGEHRQFYQGEVLGGFTIQEDGAFLLFMSKGAVAILRDGKLDYIIDELPGESENRFNDVIADPAGRVFCGTMARDSARAVAREDLGTLYRLDTNGSVTKLLDGIGISNGMGFTPDRQQMYYTDSSVGRIYVFDYDSSTGEITNQRVFVELPEGGGIPDGMTVDADGYIWSAIVGGSALHRYTPLGIRERTVSVPARMPTSVMFGGADMTDMYVTSLGGDKRTDEDDPLAGALFRLNLGIRGVPEFYSRVLI